MPKKKADGPQPAEYTVELQRLQALVDTQRRHIEELNKQLLETLEAKRQQQLQLVEQSPAPRNVKQLLARAAADNTALAKKVEELRAQRNALAVTKAALTAQLSELIRGAADDAQREQQSQLMLHQLQHLCCHIGRPDLRDPGQQMAAVIQHVQKEQRTQQALVQEVEKYKQAMPVSAATDALLMLSPTGGLSLDQTATSQLVWNSSRCLDLFPTTAGASAASAAAVDVTPAAAGSPHQSVSCKTAKSCFTDLSYISPLRSSSKPAQERTPCSCTPVTAATAGSNTRQCAAFADVEDDSPLSTQSLSMFSPSKSATPVSSIHPRRLDLVTPESKYVPGAAEGSGGCNKSMMFTQSKKRDAEQRDQQQSQGSDSPELSMMLMSPIFGVNQDDLQCPSTSRPAAAAAGATPHALANTAQRTAGLSLEAEFRLNACGTLWPSPALTSASIAAIHGSGCRAGSCSSHMLWLAAGEDPASPVPARVLALDFSPAPAGLNGSSRLRAVSPLGVWFGEGGYYELGVDGVEEAQQKQQQGSGKRRWIVFGLCVIAPLTLAAAAGGAAAWHFKREEVLEFIEAVKHGAGMVSHQTQRGATAGWRQCHQTASAAWTAAKQCLQRRMKHSTADSSNSSSGNGTPRGATS